MSWAPLQFSKNGKMCSIEPVRRMSRLRIEIYKSHDCWELQLTVFLSSTIFYLSPLARGTFDKSGASLTAHVLLQPSQPLFSHIKHIIILTDGESYPILGKVCPLVLSLANRRGEI